LVSVAQPSLPEVNVHALGYVQLEVHVPATHTMPVPQEPPSLIAVQLHVESPSHQ
jgi:hypothetical protein